MALRLSRRLTQPLREATQATATIAHGDLSVRLPVGGGRPNDELGALALSINEMADSLQRSRGLEQQFLLSVSHDLRTPLTSIQGYAEAIADGAVPDDRAAAGVILTEARRLGRLVRDLLDLAKLEARQFTFHPVDVDLGEVVGRLDRRVPTRRRHGRADPRPGPAAGPVSGDGPTPTGSPRWWPTWSRTPASSPATTITVAVAADRPVPRSRCPTTDPASPRPTCPTCSSGSTWPATSRCAPRSAPGWAWPSSASWSRPWAGGCGPRPPAAGRGPPHGPPGAPAAPGGRPSAGHRPGAARPGPAPPGSA